MDFSDEFGLKKRSSFHEALHWSKALSRAIRRWAPPITDDDLAYFSNWIGTAVASTGRIPSATHDQWIAVVLMETPAPLRLKSYRRFWQNADRYMRNQGGSFAALVVGPVRIAAGVSVGGSVGVPGGFGGTLGGTIDAGKGGVALTAGHVVSSGEKGGVAEQPADGFGDAPQTEIGRVIGWSELRRRNNRSDLGLIRLHPQIDDGERSVLSEAGLEGMVGTRVRKTGAASGTTVGDVTLFDADLSVLYADGGRRHFEGLMGIQSGGEEFAVLGDSGALVFAEGSADIGAALGMIIAVAPGYEGSEEPVCWTVSSTAMSATVGTILRDGSRTEA